MSERYVQLWQRCESQPNGESVHKVYRASWFPFSFLFLINQQTDTCEIGICLLDKAFPIEEICTWDIGIARGDSKKGNLSLLYIQFDTLTFSADNVNAMTFDGE